MANSVNTITNLTEPEKAQLRIYLLTIALREQGSLYTSQTRKYKTRKKIQIGDEVEYYNWETGEDSYGEVESIDGDEVEIYDKNGETLTVDIDEIY